MADIIVSKLANGNVHILNQATGATTQLLPGYKLQITDTGVIVETEAGLLVDTLITTEIDKVIHEDLKEVEIFSTNQLFNELYDYFFIGVGIVPPRLIGYNNITTITILQDFPLPDAGKEILLANDVYFIDGQIEMEDYFFNVDNAPVFYGLTQNISKLTSSAPGITLFTGGGGRFAIRNLDIEVIGAGSKVFDLDDGPDKGGVNTDTIKFESVQFSNCVDLGFIRGYNIVLFNVIDIENCTDGFKFDGLFSEGIILFLFRVGKGSTGTFIKFEPTIDFQGKIAGDVIFDIPAGSIGFDFTGATLVQDEAVFIRNGFYTGAGTPIVGIPDGSTKLYKSDNFGILNTDPGGEWQNQTDQISDIISADTYIDLVVDTVGGTKFLDWVSETAGEWTYLSDTPLKFTITTLLSVLSGSNNQVKAAINYFDASETTNTVITEQSGVTNGTGGTDKPANITLKTTIIMEKNDKLKMLVKNVGASTDVTTLIGSNMIIEAII